jgi:hypothetical protein
MLSALLARSYREKENQHTRTGEKGEGEREKGKEEGREERREERRGAEVGTAGEEVIF